MLSIRIVTRGVIVPALVLVSGMTAGAAMAQTADGGTAGRPLQLLQNVKQTHSAKNSAKSSTKSSTKSKTQTKAAARSASKSKTASRTPSKAMSKTASHSRPHTRLAERKQPPAPAEVAQAPASETTSAANWPAGPATPLAEVGSRALAAFPPTPPSAAPSGPVPNELVVGGQEVKVASPDKVNEIDLAAANNGVVANDAQPSTAPATTATSTPKADSATVAVAQTPASQVGSTAWIMQVLAALGGALAAGSVAWFLIGSTPQRTYG